MVHVWQVENETVYKSCLSFWGFYFWLILMPKNYSLPFSLLLEMAASYSKWYLIQIKMFKKIIELDQHVGFVLKELILKTLQCALRIFSIHLSVLHPESSLHVCLPEKDMKGQYSFGTFPLSFLHTSHISSVIQFEVMGTELMWTLYWSQLNQKEQCRLHASVFIFWSNVLQKARGI